MPEWLALPLLAAAAFLAGWLLLANLPWPDDLRWHWLERPFAALALGVAAVGWPALALAELGLYNLGRLALIWLALVGALAFFGRRRRRSRPFRLTAPPRPAEAAVLLVWLAAALWLFFRPHQYVLGGADAGVYVNLAASLDESGGFLRHDVVLAGLDPALYPLLLRAMPPGEAAPYYLLPGFYVTGRPPGRVTPQFFPLHPVWQAVAYSFGGVQAALKVTGLWAMLGSLAVYLFVRRLCGWPVAALALAGLSLNALQLWFARYPTTEPLTQYLLWAGLWALLVWRDQETVAPATTPDTISAAALVAGLCLGQLVLVRIDTYFLLALPAGLFLWRYLSGRHRPADLWFYAPLLALAAHSLLHALTLSAPYFWSVYGYGLALARRFAVFLLAGSALLLAATLWLGRSRRRLPALVPFRRSALALAVALLFIVALYGWFVRPYTVSAAAWQDWFGGASIPPTNQENLLRLGWYLSPFGVWLAVAGMALMLWRLDGRLAPVLTVGLFFSLFYLWRIQANPHQIYAMRRYVPAVMPFFIVAAAYALGWLWSRPRRWLTYAAPVLAVIWLAGLVWLARGFVSQVDYQGILPQLDALHGRLEPGSLLLFSDPAPVGAGDRLGTPLRFLYGHSVYTVRDPADALPGLIRAWQGDDRTVYWIGDPAWLDDHALAYTASSFTVRVQELEGVYDRRPVNLLTVEWALPLARLSSPAAP